MQHRLEPYCEIGPGLMLDEQFVPAWAQLSLNDLRFDGSFEEAAERGECLALRDPDCRQLSGKLWLLIDEPAPELVKYAVQHSENLKLELPTGKLRFVGLSALVKDGGLPAGAEDFLTLQLEPGTWVGEVWIFMEQAERLEGTDHLLPEESPLPGERPPTRWTVWLERFTIALSLVTLGTVLFFCVFWRALEVVLAIGVVLALLWPLRAFLHRRSGEKAREEHNQQLFAAYLATLPAVPSWVVSLRRVR